MTAVKALALGAFVVGAVMPSAMAGSLNGGQLQWSSWNAGSGSAVSNAGASGIGSHASNSVAQTAPTFASANVAAIGSSAQSSVSNSSYAPSTFSAPSSSSTYDAYINMGNGPYPNASLLTTGGAQPWYNSSSVASLYGGQPSTQQQADFTNAVLQRVQQTFQLSGVPVNLTADPSAPAAHTLSVVSNTTSTWGPVLGLTDIGSNGFDFVDQAAKSAKNVDQLEWLVAHNVAHELMLGFGVGENYDKSGQYIDSPVANTGMMFDPKATFSQSASQALLAANFQNAQGALASTGAQVVSPQPVPEPTTIVLWTLAGTVVVVARRGRSQAA